MTAKKKRALAALLRFPTVTAAAEAAGVSYSSLRSWLKNDIEFRQAYQEELAGLISEAATQAKQSLAPAISTLTEIMQNKKWSAAARVSAARSLIDVSLKLTEITDIISRVEALEDDSQNRGNYV